MRIQEIPRIRLDVKHNQPNQTYMSPTHILSVL